MLQNSTLSPLPTTSKNLFTSTPLAPTKYQPQPHTQDTLWTRDPGARQSPKCFNIHTHLILTATPQGMFHVYSHFADEAQRGQMTCPRSHSYQGAELSSNLAIWSQSPHVSPLHDTALPLVFLPQKLQWAMGFLSAMKAEPKLLATENLTSHFLEAGKAWASKAHSTS